MADIETPSAPDTNRLKRDNELIDLLRQVSGGDQVAFRKLYRLTSPLVYGVLLRMFKQPDAAEDALQETFVKVWNKADSYRRSHGKPLTWITSIARYHALDVLRAQRSSASRENEYMAQQEITAKTLSSLESEVGDSQLLSICLDRLDENARDCVVSAYCGGYSHRELSEQTGHALGTVKTWIRRSLQSLRECVDELRA